MGKVKRKFMSLKWSFVIYLSVCFAVAFAGAMAVGLTTNYFQDQYRSLHSDVRLDPPPDKKMEMFLDNGEYYNVTYEATDGVPFAEKKYMRRYFFISYAQIILVPLWMILCVAVTGVIFYRCELKKPIDILFDASYKITDNKLDFEVEYEKQNEFGTLCTAFDEMRTALYRNNQEMWRSLEERKRLNSAFSHDLRTPLTVLKGYADFLEKYIPDGKVSQEKMLSVISLMNGQIARLEHYTQKMNAVQKLEDIVPNRSCIYSEKIFDMLAETGKLICGDHFQIKNFPENKKLFIDTELVMQVYENLISNAVRYTKSFIKVNCSLSGNMLEIAVSDDGNGFTEIALKNASQPFFRDEKETDKMHFGLGLYICRIICEKCGGYLTIENHENGGKVTANFYYEKNFESG